MENRTTPYVVSMIEIAVLYMLQAFANLKQRLSRDLFIAVYLSGDNLKTS
ncbi:hypothetical protein [Paenibacillus donghaensis]|nr:hypothetical protein [Paenibacillus donghaensis]